MREIKFRAWDKKNKQMCLPEPYRHAISLHFGSNGYVEIGNGADVLFLQYTGLKDKNGKEIYEGDILRCADWVEDAQAYNEWEREVKWDEECAGFVGIDGENNLIIGNIYENPGLL